MDPATIIGIVLAFVAVFGSMIMEGGSPGAIILVAPLFLVFVGTLGAVMAGATMKDTIGIVASLKKAFLAKKVENAPLIDSVVGLAERARKEGLLALEDAIKGVDNVFLKSGLQLAVDGTDPEELREILEGQVAAKQKADKTAAKLFEDMGGYSPTIGIIGTVIGLIHVLENLSTPSKLGPLISGAFVATLWGVLSANVMWLPIANRLKRVSGLECEQMQLSIEGILAIQAGANPRLVAQKLKSLLPPGAPEKKAA
jgi:chemotaxis protein MotA